MKKKRNLLTIISSILGCIAICGFSVFGLLTRSKEKVQTKADDRVLYSYTTTNDFELQFYLLSGTSITAVQSGPFNLHWSLSFDYSISELSNSYYVRVSHNISTQINQNYSISHIGVDNFNNYAEPSDMLTFQFSINYLKLVRTTNKSTYIINYTLSNFGTPFATHDFSIDGSTWGTAGGTMNLQYGGTYSYSINPGEVETINVPGDVIYWVNTSYVPEGYDTGYAVGYTNGYNQGYTQGNSDGYQIGVADGNASGYETGYQAGVDSQASVIQNAYSSGYADGYEQGHSQDSTVATIFSGILQVAMVPVNFFLAIFNFEILGINLSAFIRAIFTVVLTIIVLKTVTGKGGGSSDN